MEDQVAMNMAMGKAVAEITSVATQAIAEVQSLRTKGQQEPI